jgi:hypothetical protein
VRRLLLTLALAATATGCVFDEVDRGDNFVPPDLSLDEDFFYCQIQPNVVSAQSCASGQAGEAGTCHSARSSLRLSVTAETDTPPACDAANVVTGTVPPSYQENFQAVQFTVQNDPTSSSFYRRPLGLDSHPRVIFDEASPEADLIRRWIATGGS